ncbi:hypothetical protein GFGA_1d0324 [Gluconobacter frateurii NBRC 103465]|nr:hypothetical protein GFGA_1d0324 [Gluconobacter frateurii NBRC 103465]
MDHPLPAPEPLPDDASPSRREWSRSSWTVCGLACVCLTQVLGGFWYFHHQNDSRANRRASINRALTPAMKYPKNLLLRQIQDRVSLTCQVDPTGHAHGCHITDGRYMEFNQTALVFVEHAIFNPALQNGHPVKDDHYTLHINFRVK